MNNLLIFITVTCKLILRIMILNDFMPIDIITHKISLSLNIAWHFVYGMQKKQQEKHRLVSFINGE